MTPNTPAVTWADPARHAAFDHWLQGLATAQGLRPETLRPDGTMEYEIKAGDRFPELFKP